MKAFLYWCVGIIARIHNQIMQLNNIYGIDLTDKQMHFLVIGLLGMGMIFVVYPLFRFLAKRNHEMVITWIYVFTVVVVITFAIEIGQKISKTGNMEFADIAYGIVGFLVMFILFSLCRGVFHLLRKLIRFIREHTVAHKAE